ncbi:MAG: NAD(P)H-hydrate epimerase [Planctomycetota bacterium]
MSDALHLRCEDLRAIDRLAVLEFGIPSIVLMENAGRGAAEVVLRVLGERRAAGLAADRVAIVCGPGNNGGDGAVVARHLANEGVTVEIVATHRLDALAGDAAIMRRIAEHMEIPVHELATAEPVLARADVVVDALLGTGFTGEVRPALARVIECMNAVRSRAPERATIVALDLPSGLDADGGHPSNATVVADWTITFAARKVGFRTPESARCLGRVVVASIGAPRSLVERFAR